ncbi:MAG: C-terminal binding protein [Candidatus Bathyarchaeota archaeon]|nr:MAG: C-terminal binding protein [Candidatus Bathyarchaeota archaeon]
MCAKYEVVLTDHHHLAEYDGPSIEKEVLGDLANIKDYRCETEDDLIKAAENADAIIILFCKMGARAIRTFKKCKIIERLGVGYDNIDLKEAGAKGIPVSNVPDYGVDEVSDHCITLILSLARKIIALDKSVKAGLWNPSKFKPLWRFKDKTLGIVGLGRMGTAVARRAKAFGANVVAYDPYIRRGIEYSLGIERVDDLETLLRSSDVVTIHTPLNEETFHLIGHEELQMMKKTAYLVNTARGGVVDSKALTQALKEGKIAGAALDVLEKEPPDPTDPLLKMENVVLSPHSAYYSEVSLATLRRKAAEEVRRALTGKKLFYVVNSEYLVQSNII